MADRHPLTEGVRRVLRRPSLVVWLYLSSVLIALPLAMVVRDEIRDSLGSSLAHEDLRRGFDMGWYGEYQFGREGVSATFGPSVIGFLPFLSNLEQLVDGELWDNDKSILGAAALYLLFWCLLSGGILRCYLQPSASFDRKQLFSSGSEYFFRFFRLLLLSLLVYYAILRWIAQPLHTWLEKALIDVTVERTAILLTFSLYAVTLMLLAFASMVFDYAKISMVAEDRSSALLAVARGTRFVLSRFRKAGSLYLSLMIAGLVLVTVYAFLAPGPSQSTLSTVLAAFLFGQAFIVLRIMLKLWFLASQSVLFQSPEIDRREPADALAA